MNTKILNDIEIKPIRIKKDKTELFGSDILPDPYGVVAMISKTNSGKTTALYNILQHTIDPKRRSNVVIFCSTLDLDQNYTKIISMLEKRKCNVFKHYSFIENGENLISHYMDIIKEGEEEEEEENVKIERIILPGGFVKEVRTNIEKKKKKKKEPTMLSPKWIFIFDDLGKDTRSNYMNYVMKARHFKIRTFILTQHLSNIAPIVRKQIATCLLFRSFSKDKLQMIYEDLDIEISFKVFENLYKYATKSDYSFLTYDVYKQIFRKNFNILLKPEIEE